MPLTHGFTKRPAQVTTLVVAEQDGDQVGVSTLSTIRAASCLGGDIAVLVAGQDIRQSAEHAASVPGVAEASLEAMGPTCSYRMPLWISTGLLGRCS